MGIGKVDVTGIWASHNTGTVLFPRHPRPNHGGITQGFYYVDGAGGLRPGLHQGTNFDAYPIPTALDALTW